jgi:hypothetical protein
MAGKVRAEVVPNPQLFMEMGTSADRRRKTNEKANQL